MLVFFKDEEPTSFTTHLLFAKAPPDIMKTIQSTQCDKTNIHEMT